jgi:hypothetical protein
MSVRKSGGRPHKPSSKKKISSSLKAFHKSRRELLTAAIASLARKEDGRG